MFSKTIIKNMFYAMLVSFSLSLFSAGAMADQSSDLAEQKTEAAISEIVSKPINLNEDGGEYFHIWLSQIFGDFIYAPWDSKYESGNVLPLAYAVGFTNILAIMLGLIIVYYVMLGGAVNTAHSGEVLGKQWSSIWIPVRTATGFSLIMPITTIGGGVLSFAQVFIIWVIILGSNAATVLWEQSVDHFLNPSVSVSSPDGNKANERKLRGFKSSLKVGLKPTTDIAIMLNCTQNYMNFLATDKNQSDIKDNGKTVATIFYGDGTKKSVISNSWNSETSAYTIEGASVKSDLAPKGTGNNAVFANSIEFAYKGSCGLIKLSTQQQDSDHENFTSESDYKVTAMNNAFKATASAVGEAVDALSPLVAKYVNDVKLTTSVMNYKTEKGFQGGGAGEGSVYDTDVIAFYGIAGQFNNSLITDVYSAITADQNIKDQWKNDMIDGGWAQAGIWFYELGSLEQMVYTVINSFETSSANLQMCMVEDGFFSFWTSDECESAISKMDIGVSLVNGFSSDSIQYAKEKGYNDVVTGFDRTRGECSVGSTCTTKSENIASSSVDNAKLVIDILAEGANATNRTDGIANPFQTITSIGNTLNVIAETTFVAAGIASGAADAAYDASKKPLADLTPASIAISFLKGMGQWYLNAVLALCASLIACGFTLAYALPMLPIVTWILMMTGYLITVVEAVIAAPLAIILMVTPEGEGIAGTRLERAMSLIAVAVLKPSLMIIGLIASITISGVAFAIQNEFFFVAAKYNLYGNILDFVAIVIIYTMTTLQLCKLLISIMHTLPNQILEWFSSGVGSRSFGEDSVSSAVESGSGAIGNFASSASKSMGDSFAQSSRAKRKASLYKPSPDQVMSDH